MKTTKYIVAMLAGVAALASCVKEAGNQLPAPEDLITIKAQLPEDVTTKAGAHVGFSWLWNDGDKITVSNGEDTQVYNIKAGFSAKIAEFVGKPVDGESFTISYPADAATADWSKQTQKGNNSYAHLKYAAQLSDVDDYLTFAFDPDWAAAHNGTLKQIGVMKMIIALPDTVTAVNGVSIIAEDAIFFKGNGDEKVKKLEVAVEDATPDSKHNFIAWFTTSWNEVTIPENTVLTVSVKTKGTPIEKDVTFTKESVLMSGKVNVFNVDNTGWVMPSHYAAGKGTADKPWIIETADQMSYMFDDMADGETRYFKLGADIDMKDINDWKPLNAEGSFEKKIDFDGAGFTISNFSCTNATAYTSFFGVLYGKCYNVKFVNAKITANTKGCGILGGYGGTGGKPCEVNNVHVQGTVTSTTGNCAGGMFGTGREATITNSSADVVINCTGQQNGGIIGVDAGTGVTISNCWTSGSITSTASIIGGIAGDLICVNSSITNCFSTMNLTTQYYFGGIVGRANGNVKGSKANNGSSTMRATIANCIAWNNVLTSNCADANEHYSNGAVIGSTGQKNTLKNCWRKADITFTDCAGNAAKGTDYVFVDQEDADPDHPLVWGSGTYSCGYHGKAAGASETISQVAQRIGWNAEVWDFSGDTPKLK
jgi:hypothetical protein